MTRQFSMCTPETYYDPGMQTRMLQRRRQADHQWIFDLIDGVGKNEEVFIENDDWMLCRDRHPGSEDRFLVIFKDTSLYTIRELSDAHIPMLMQVQLVCRQFLDTHARDETNTWRLYFNYLPSVLQLHLHVSRSTSPCNNRIQPLACVVRNLRKNPKYYTTAIILTSTFNRASDYQRDRLRSAVRIGARADALEHQDNWRSVAPKHTKRNTSNHVPETIHESRPYANEDNRHSWCMTVGPHKYRRMPPNSMHNLRKKTNSLKKFTHDTPIFPSKCVLGI